MSNETSDPDRPDHGMDDILASIRRIVSEERQVGAAAPTAASVPTAEPAGGEVLELTDLVEDGDPPDDDEEDERLAAMARALTATAAAAVPATDPRETPAVVAQLKGLREAAKVAKALERGHDESQGPLAPSVLHAVQPLAERWVQAHMPEVARDSIEEAVRPLVQEWVDRHLESVVERIVREEVVRMVEMASRD